jgi:hypothetical protein
MIQITIIKKKLLLLLSFIFIFIFFNGSSYLFNGLPWANKYETLIILTLPFFIILYLKQNIKNRILNITIILILIIKCFLIFSPSLGVGHKISYNENFKNITTVKESFKFIKSYNSIWNRSLSSLQQFDWNSKSAFPLDWVNYNHFLNNVNGLTVTTNQNYKNLAIRDEVEFYLFLEKERKFKIHSIGIKEHDLQIQEINKQTGNTDELKKFIYDKTKNSFGIPFKLKKGIYKISGKISFQGLDWSFVPKIYLDNGEAVSALSKRLIFYEESFDYNYSALLVYKYFGLMFDFFVILLSFIMIFSVYFKKENFENFKYIFLSLIFLFSYVLLHYLINFLSSSNYEIFKFAGLISPFALNFLFFLLLMFFFNFIKLDLIKNIFKKNLSTKYLLIFFPTIIIFTLYKFGHTFEKTYFWTHGDDWTVFQNYASLIIIENKWIYAGEDIFYFRPGARYIYGIIHALFGDSVFAQFFIEVTLIFLISFFVVYYLIRNNVSQFWSLCGGIILMVLYFGENFRWLIGRGLSEYYLTFFILSTFIILNKKILKNYSIIFAAFLGIIACWLREDKLLTVLSLIVVCNISSYKNNFFTFSFYFLFNNYFKIILYVLIVILGFPILFELRNYYVGGDFTITSHPNVFRFNIQSLYKFLFATPWDTLPRLTPLFLFVPAFLSFLSLLIPYAHRKLRQPEISIIILSSLIPAFFLEMAAYIPRYSISLLPFGVIYMMTFANLISKNRKV